MSHNTPSQSSLDFLKACSTGVDLIAGFSSVHYWVYTAQALPDTSTVADQKSLNDALFVVEAAVRGRKHIVYHDAARNALWCFAGASDPPFNQPPELENGGAGIEQYGWTLKIIFSGMFKASELSVYSSRLAASHPAGPSQQSGSSTGPTNTAANTRAFQQNATVQAVSSTDGTIGFPYDRNDVKSVHTFFIRGVQACFAYILAKECSALQLDSRTFVTFPDGGNDDEEEETSHRSLPVFTLDTSLANGGGMLVSTTIRDDLSLCQYMELPPEAGEETTVVIAPGGLFAKVVLGRSFTETSEVRAWKVHVRSQLRAKGIDLGEMDSQDRWVPLKTHLQPQQNDNDLGEETIFFWPLALCFSPLPAPSGLSRTSCISQIGEPIDAYWFRQTGHEDEDGYKDPLGFARDWYDDKAIRDKTVAERRNRIDIAKKQVEIANLAVASPSYTREGLQATAGVYPTPPDGLLSSQAQSMHDVPAVSLPVDPAGHRSSLDMQHSDMMDLDMGPFDENVRQRPSLISRGSLDAAMKVGGDDLFGDDMVDDDLRGQDVTDADFSFFDEPEMPDTLMMDESDHAGDNEHVKSKEGAGVAHHQSGNAVSGVEAHTFTVQNLVQRDIRDPLPQLNEPPSNQDVAPPSEVEDTPLNDTKLPNTDATTAHTPLSPASLRKKLFEFAVNPLQQGRKASQFQPLAFNTMIGQNDAKYSLSGAFGFKTRSMQVNDSTFATSPRIKPRPPDIKGRYRTSPGLARSYDSDSGSDVTDSSDDESAYGNEVHSFVSSPNKSKIHDGISNAGDDVQSISTSNMVSREDFSIMLSQQPFVLSSILMSISDQVRSRTAMRLLRFQDLPGKRLASAKDRLLPSLVQAEGPLNPFHKDFINVAQIVSEQLAVGFVNELKAAWRLATGSSDIYPRSTRSLPRLKAVMAAIRSCCPATSQCDLLRWLCVQEATPEKQNMPKGHPPMPPKKVTISGLQTSDGIPVPASALAPLSPPHVRVRRNEGLWDVLPPALPFWEQLGLAPAAGRKNVMAFCVYPGVADLTAQVSLFMDYLGATYESCKLGAHVRATQLGNVADGMVPVRLSAEQIPHAVIQSIRESCVELGKTLAGIDWNNKIDFNPAIEDLNRIDNFVIYMVNPFEDDPQGLMQLCSSFWALYEAYRQAVASPMLRTSQPDVVLQILPIRHLASPHAPIIMDVAFFQKLAREVYDRCPPAVPEAAASRLPIESAAAVQLEQPLPRKIDFKLQADPPPDLLHEGSNLHLGYARSYNGEWVSVAWTDGTGKYQATSSYCLVGGRSFAEVARIIWQSTIEIMQARRVAWRLCIARVGVLEKEELDVWSMLATSASPVVMITVIMAVDPNPPISVFHEQATLSSKLGGQGASQTPVGTPRSGVSPDTVLTPAATPNTETGPDLSNDPDAHLVDIRDETWGLILGHRTNVSNSVADYRPSLSTGYLMKVNTSSTNTPDDTDESEPQGVILVGVKLVWIGSSPKPAPQPQTSQQASPLPLQSPYSAMPANSPTEIAAASGLSIPPTPTATNVLAQQPGQLNTSTSGSTIPKVTADSILRDYLQMYRNLGVLARARGLQGTKRGAIPWHVLVASRAVEGLEASYGTIQSGS